MKKVLKRLIIEMFFRKTLIEGLKRFWYRTKSAIGEKIMLFTYNKLSRKIIKYGIEDSVVRIIKDCEKKNIDWRPHVIDLGRTYDEKLDIARMVGYEAEFLNEYYVERDIADALYA